MVLICVSSLPTVQTMQVLILVATCKSSVFTQFKEENNLIIKANYNAHVVHNMTKHGMEQLTVDIESIVLKIFAHFSGSAKRRADLI